MDLSFVFLVRNLIGEGNGVNRVVFLFDFFGFLEVIFFILIVRI